MLWLWMVTSVRAEVVDGILHVIGDRIVTRSDVEFEREFDRIDRSALPVLDDPDYPIEQRLVDFAILRDLARDIEIYRPSTGEVRARWERFHATWSHPDEHAAFLARWGMDDEQLLGLFYSRLVVERYVARNAVGSRGANAADPLTSAEYQSWMVALRARATVRSPE